MAVYWFNIGYLNITDTEYIVSCLLQAKIDVDIKLNEKSRYSGKKAIHFCKERSNASIKLLIEIGYVAEEDAKDQVTRLLDRGKQLEEEGELDSSVGAIVNYRVANVMCK